MTHEEMAKLESALNEVEHDLLFSKNADYASKEDALSNFKQLAAMTGSTPKRVWSIYWMKHTLSILRYIRDGKLSSETIASRINDSRVYLLLLAALIEDEARAESLKGNAKVTPIEKGRAKRR